jgi:hypothetical protein
MRCDGKKRGSGKIVCQRCGRIFPVGATEATVAACRYGQSMPGLGTRIANALSAIGYTKERHVAIKKRLGLAPTCGCEKREAQLNQFGRR